MHLVNDLVSLGFGGGAELVDAYIYEIIWSERYAAILYCPVGAMEGYKQSIFVLKNAMLTDTIGMQKHPPRSPSSPWCHGTPRRSSGS
jgi:hypothetical protein